MSSLSSILQQARASLANPSRPQTPRVDGRHMANSMKLGGEMEILSRPGSASLERPSTAYGWNDAMGSLLHSDNYDENPLENMNAFDSLQVDNSISLQEKRMIKERLNSRPGTKSGSRLGIQSSRYQSKVESKTRSELLEKSSLHNHSSSSTSSKNGDVSDSKSLEFGSSKEDVLKGKIIHAVFKYDAQKLEKYLESSIKSNLEENAKDWISYSVKQLLNRHQSGEESDKQLLEIVSVSIKHLEQYFDRSSVFGFYRILYKISKDSKYDDQFRTLNLLVPLIRLGRRLCEGVKGKKDWELLLYCIAILKNVSYDSQVNKTYLSEHDALGLLRIVLESTVKYIAKEQQERDKPLQLLVQVTACLRNLVNTDDDFLAVSKSGILQILCPLAKNLLHHQELTFNICRIMSKISLHEECQYTMNEECTNFYKIMLSVLSHYKDNVAIIIRICFILGNLTYDNEEKRAEFSLQSDVPLLLNLLETYDKRDITLSQEVCEDEKLKIRHQKEKRDVEDLLTKLIRLIANISIDKERGSYLTYSMQTICLIQILNRKSVHESEELVLNVVRCITNLTYYENETRSNGNRFVPEGTLFKHKLQLCELLSPLLLHDHPDAVLESARTFGNLSQDVTIQAWMHQRRLDEVMLILIDHDNFDLVSAVCGVLINLTTQKTDFFTSNNFARLLEVLDYANEPLAILIFKLIHNLIVHSPAGQLEHLDLLYECIENIVEGVLENESLSEEEEILVAIGKRLLSELTYENLPEENIA